MQIASLNRITLLKNSLMIAIILTSPAVSPAQPFSLEKPVVDNYKDLVAKHAPDTATVHAFYWLSRNITLSNTSEAIDLAGKGLDLARKIKFRSGEIECMESLCFCYALTGAFEKGFSTAFAQMELSKKYDPVRENAGMNFMALLYQKLGDDQESLVWAQKAYYHPLRKQSDPFTQWSAMFLLSQAQEKVNNLDSAYLFASETVAHSKHYFPRQEGWPMMIMARVDSKRGKFNEAIEYCNSILESVRKYDLGFFKHEVENELALIYSRQGQTDSAQKYASEALDGAVKFKNYLVIMNSAGLLAGIYEKTDPAKAYDFLKISGVAKDTVTSTEKTKQVKQLEIKEKQRVEDLHLADVYAKNEFRFYSVIVLLASALVIALILFRNNRNKQKANLALKDKNEKIEKTVAALNSTQASLLARNAENELLLKEIHHRVKNNLEVVSSLLELQSKQIDDPNTKDAMLASQNRVHSIGIVHQKLYQGEHLGAIEMKDYFINLSESILDSFSASKRVQVECAMNALNVDIDTAVPLGLIVNELLTNTIKYAFPDGRTGKVQIKLEKAANGNLQMLVSDNGVGKSDTIQGTGFGGQLIQLLTRQLGGTIKEDKNNGTHISFEFTAHHAA